MDEAPAMTLAERLREVADGLEWSEGPGYASDVQELRAVAEEVERLEAFRTHTRDAIAAEIAKTVAEQSVSAVIDELLMREDVRKALNLSPAQPIPKE